MSYQIPLFTSSNIIRKTPCARYEYEMTATVGTHKLGGKFIMSYAVEKNFESYMFPKRILTLAVPDYMYKDILDGVTPDKPLIPVKIDIIVKAVHDVLGEVSTIIAPFFQGDFMGFLDKTKAPKDIVKPEHLKRNPDDTIDAFYTLNIALFDLEDLNFAKEGTVSGNMGSGKTVEDLIKHAFEVCKGKNKCTLALAPADNKNTLKNVIVSSRGFLQFLDFIDNEYGIYKSRYNVFVDNNVCYILNTEKNDTGMNTKYKGTKDDKIWIHAYDYESSSTRFIGVQEKDGHFLYSIIRDSSVEDEIALDATMRHVDITINSTGAKSKSTVSSNKKESISPSIKVQGGRSRSVNKENRNPKFKANVYIVDLPVFVQPYTIVRYIADNRVGDCMIVKVNHIFAQGQMSTGLYIKSYDEFMPYGVPETKTGKNLNKK